MTARDVACPYCGAEPRDHCTEMLPDGPLRRLTNPHAARWVREQEALAPTSDGAGETRGGR